MSLNPDSAGIAWLEFQVGGADDDSGSMSLIKDALGIFYNVALSPLWISA